MPRIFKSLALAAIASLTLAGCAATSGEAEATTTPTPTKTELGLVNGVDELREAYTAAGFSCDWEPNGNPRFAAEQGACSSNTVLMYFISRGDMQELISTHRALRESVDLGPMGLVVGPNWIINSDKDAASIQAELGGELVED